MRVKTKLVSSASTVQQGTEGSSQAFPREIKLRRQNNWRQPWASRLPATPILMDCGEDVAQMQPTAGEPGTTHSRGNTWAVGIRPTEAEEFPPQRGEASSIDFLSFSHPDSIPASERDVNVNSMLFCAWSLGLRYVCEVQPVVCADTSQLVLLEGKPGREFYL